MTWIDAAHIIIPMVAALAGYTMGAKHCDDDWKRILDRRERGE